MDGKLYAVCIDGMRRPLADPDIEDPASPARVELEAKWGIMQRVYFRKVCSRAQNTNRMVFGG